MTIEEAIYDLLTSDAGVTALVGTRVYPGEAPPGTALPLVIYQQANRRSTWALGRRINLNGHTMHLDVYGASYASVKAVWAAIDAALVGYRGSAGAGTIDVRGIFDDDAADGMDPPIHADDDGVHSVGMDLAVWFRST